MILPGSFVQINGFGLALVSAMKLWIASVSSLSERNTPRLRRRLARSANRPSTALSQDAEVGVKWKTKRGWRASHSMTLVVVGDGGGPPLLHRQTRLGAVARLNLALLIDRQNDGMVRRIDIEADDVAQLGDELRVIGQLELTHPVGLQAMGAPDALDRTDADPDRFGHGRA